MSAPGGEPYVCPSCGPRPGETAAGHAAEHHVDGVIPAVAPPSLTRDSVQVRGLGELDGEYRLVDPATYDALNAELDLHVDPDPQRNPLETAIDCLRHWRETYSGAPAQSATE